MQGIPVVPNGDWLVASSRSREQFEVIYLVHRERAFSDEDGIVYQGDEVSAVMTDGSAVILGERWELKRADL